MLNITLLIIFTKAVLSDIDFNHKQKHRNSNSGGNIKFGLFAQLKEQEKNVGQESFRNRIMTSKIGIESNCEVLKDSHP